MKLKFIPFLIFSSLFCSIDDSLIFFNNLDKKYGSEAVDSFLKGNKKGFKVLDIIYSVRKGMREFSINDFQEILLILKMMGVNTDAVCIGSDCSTDACVHTMNSYDNYNVYKKEIALFLMINPEWWKQASSQEKRFVLGKRALQLKYDNSLPPGLSSMARADGIGSRNVLNGATDVHMFLGAVVFLLGVSTLFTNSNDGLKSFVKYFSTALGMSIPFLYSVFPKLLVKAEDKEIVAKLECEKGAIEHLEKELETNKALRETAGLFRKSFYTESGNDLLDYQNPLLTSRIEQLRGAEPKLEDVLDSFPQ